MRLSFRRGGRRGPLTKVFCALLMLSGIVWMIACSRSAAKFPTCVTDKKVSPNPAHVGPVTVSFHLSDAAKPVSGAQVSLEGDMTHAGMPPTYSDAYEVAPGQYQGKLTLNMPGDWVLLLHITFPDGRKVEDQIDIRGVQSS
jgi:hypothetical protein